ncbi:TetR-like C-terminal domain-containing protein, partial [Streptomyces lydicus]|uniref:TetR-like C-terminal domain-containing protein n=2 Tax=Streptomyces TaxID=1883 RepID=UPI00332CBB65
LDADLTSWARQFLDEMASGPGRAYVRDALLGDPDGSNAGRCSAYAADQIEAVLARAAERGETAPTVEAVLDHVVAPMMYRILFRPGPLPAGYADQLVRAVLAAPHEPTAR